MTAVALPSVRRAERRLAPDGIPPVALLALPAPGDVVDDNPVAHPEPTRARTEGHDLAAGLVTGDHPLVGLRPVPQVLAVDGADVAAADRRGAHADEHLTVPGARDLEGDELDGAVPGQADALHRGHAHSCGRMTDLMAPGRSRAAVSAAAVSARPN